MSYQYPYRVSALSEELDTYPSRRWEVVAADEVSPGDTIRINGAHHYVTAIGEVDGFDGVSIGTEHAGALRLFVFHVSDRIHVQIEGN